jgi:hypothetical protein
VAPAPAAPAYTPPPPDKRFTQPGGYNFPQGSINHRKAVDPSPKDYRTGTTAIARAARPRSNGIALASATTTAKGEEKTPENTPLEIGPNADSKPEDGQQLAFNEETSEGVGITDGERQADEQNTEQEAILIAAATEAELKPVQGGEDVSQSLGDSPMSYQTARNILAAEESEAAEKSAGGAVIRIVESEGNRTTVTPTSATSTTKDSAKTAKHDSAAPVASGSEPAKLARTLPAGSSRDYVDLSPRKSTQEVRPVTFHEDPRIAGTPATAAEQRVAASNGAAFEQRGAAGNGTAFERRGGGSDGPAAAQWGAGGNAPAYSYDPQYGWLRGKLEHSAAANRWKLRYIPIDGQTDEFGGSVVLSNPSLLKEFSPGQMVMVQGSVGNGPAEHGRFSPLFELRSIQAQ